MKTPLILLIFMLSGATGFCQHALSGSIGFLSGEMLVNYKTSSDTSANRGIFKIQRSPTAGLAVFKNTRQGNFYQLGLYNLYFNRYDQQCCFETPSGSQQTVTDGSKFKAAGGGVLFRYGLKAGQLGPRWPIYVSSNAGGYFQTFKNTPYGSLRYPVSAEFVGLEAGFRLHLSRQFGDAGFMSLSLPLIFVEIQHTHISVENPALAFDQQNQKKFNYQFMIQDRMGIELASGLYLQQNKK